MSSSERTSHAVTSGLDTVSASSRTLPSIRSPWKVNASCAPPSASRCAIAHAIERLLATPSTSPRFPSKGSGHSTATPTTVAPYARRGRHRSIVGDRRRALPGAPRAAAGIVVGLSPTAGAPSRRARGLRRLRPRGGRGGRGARARAPSADRPARQQRRHRRPRRTSSTRPGADRAADADELPRLGLVPARLPARARRRLASRQRRLGRRARRGRRPTPPRSTRSSPSRARSRSSSPRGIWCTRSTRASSRRRAFRSRGSRPRVQRVVIRPEDVAAHVLRSLAKGRGETTVPWFYGPIAPLQDAMPNLFTRVLGRTPKAP